MILTQEGTIQLTNIGESGSPEGSTYTICVTNYRTAQEALAKIVKQTTCAQTDAAGNQIPNTRTIAGPVESQFGGVFASAEDENLVDPPSFTVGTRVLFQANLGKFYTYNAEITAWSDDGPENGEGNFTFAVMATSVCVITPRET